MSISAENKAVMARKLGRIVRADTKITLTGQALSSIIDAAREDERAKRPREDWHGMAKLYDVFFNGRRS